MGPARHVGQHLGHHPAGRRGLGRAQVRGEVTDSRGGGGGATGHPSSAAVPGLHPMATLLARVSPSASPARVGHRRSIRENGDMRKRVAVLGSTGSIGTQALEVIAANPERFEVVALAAGGGNPRLLAEQAIAFDVPLVAVARASAAEDVQLALYAEAQRKGYAHGDHRVPRLIAGPDAAVDVARIECDVVLNGMTGAVGLLPTLAALEAGTTLA